MQAPIDHRRIAERLKSARVVAGMERKDVAGRLQVTVAAISLWERGDTLPSLENLVRLSKLYGVSVDRLLGLRMDAA